MWELDHKEGWAAKNWYFWTVVLNKTLENPLDCKEEIKPVNPKGNQSWIFIGRTDAEGPILRPPDANGWLIRKDPNAGKVWRQEEKGMTESKLVGWHHWLNGHEFEQVLGEGEGQGTLLCCCPWGSKELDTTEQLKDNCSRRFLQLKSGASSLTIRDSPQKILNSLPRHKARKKNKLKQGLWNNTHVPEKTGVS